MWLDFTLTLKHESNKRYKPSALAPDLNLCNILYKLIRVILCETASKGQSSSVGRTRFNYKQAYLMLFTYSFSLKVTSVISGLSYS